MNETTVGRLFLDFIINPQPLKKLIICVDLSLIYTQNVDISAFQALFHK